MTPENAVCVWFDHEAGVAAHYYSSVVPDSSVGDIANGESPEVVSQRLGHASVAFTLQQYAHVMPEHDGQSADHVAAIMFGDEEHDDEQGA